MKRLKTKSHRPKTIDQVLDEKIGPAHLFRDRKMLLSDVDREALMNGFVIRGGSLVLGYDWVVMKLATGVLYHATRTEVIGR